jgi:hypothetical protein
VLDEQPSSLPINDSLCRNEFLDTAVRPRAEMDPENWTAR